MLASHGCVTLVRMTTHSCVAANICDVQKALTIKSAIPHPRIMGVIRECGGKMHMQQRAWAEAATDFFEVRWVGLGGRELGRRAADGDGQGRDTLGTA
jgi:hypothetical protein